MSYEYEFKEYIRDEILSNINHMNILDDALDELDHVYTQAAKSDEYEAKAEAWDKLMFEIDEINNEAAGKGLPSKIIMAAKITALSNVMKESDSGE